MPWTEECTFSGPQGGFRPLWLPPVDPLPTEDHGSGSGHKVPWAVPEGGWAAGGRLCQRHRLLSSCPDHRFPALGPSGRPAHFPLPLNCFLGVTPGTGSLVGKALGSGLAAHSGECEPGWRGRGAGPHEAEHWGAQLVAHSGECEPGWGDREQDLMRLSGGEPQVRLVQALVRTRVSLPEPRRGRTHIISSWLDGARLPRHFHHIRLFATPRTAAHQAPLSMGCSRQGDWSRLPCPPAGGLPDPGRSPRLEPPALAGGPFTTTATREAQVHRVLGNIWRESDLSQTLRGCRRPRHAVSFHVEHGHAWTE